MSRIYITKDSNKIYEELSDKYMRKFEDLENEVDEKFDKLIQEA